MSFIEVCHFYGAPLVFIKSVYYAEKESIKLDLRASIQPRPIRWQPNAERPSQFKFERAGLSGVFSLSAFYHPQADETDHAR
jgi:hypothetical protein